MFGSIAFLGGYVEVDESFSDVRIREMDEETDLSITNPKIVGNKRLPITKGRYIAEEDKLEKFLENPQVIKAPVVRNGKQSTLGYQPDVWKKWE